MFLNRVISFRRCIYHLFVTFTISHFSYETAISLRSMLKEVNWTYIVVDEGHRLKNKDCRLSVELKKIKSKNRLLLTGTPLQNDLEELCALLSYLQPDLFTHHELFSVEYASISFKKLFHSFAFETGLLRCQEIAQVGKGRSQRDRPPRAEEQHPLSDPPDRRPLHPATEEGRGGQHHPAQERSDGLLPNDFATAPAISDI